MFGMPLTPDNKTALIEAIRAAAREEIMPRFRNLDPSMISAKSGPLDLVTVADQEAEKHIARAVARILPEALFIGEEAVAEDPALLDRLKDADLAVIIDPVDGTANYAADLAVFGTILAVVHQGKTIFGVLYDPVLDDWIWAEAGQGAWLSRPGAEDRRLSGPTAKPKGDAMGYVPLNLFDAGQQQGLVKRYSQLGRMFNLRCSCHEYRMVALGHADYLVSPSGKPWDHAAGCLVVEECGGHVSADGTAGYVPGEGACHIAVLGHEDGALTLEDVQLYQ